MNKYIGQQFAALRYEKNILVVEETTSAGCPLDCGEYLGICAEIEIGGERL